MKHGNNKQTNQSKKYICDFCDFETCSEMQLTKHEKDVHMRTKLQFSCDHCKKVFETSSKRDEHIKEAHQRNYFLCDICNYKANGETELNQHLENKHRFSRVERKRISGYSKEEREYNGVCVFWNNGNCKFEDRCKYSHEEIPQCNFDGYCRNSGCRYFHSLPNVKPQASKSPFLFNRGLQNNPQHRRTFGGAQNNQGQRR